MTANLYADRASFPALQDIISWYGAGFIQSVQMRRTEESDEVETYQVVITAKKHNGNSMARKESLD